MTEKNLQTDGDIRISSALMAPFVILTVQYLVIISLNLAGTSLEVGVRLASKLFVTLVFAYAIPTVFQRRKAKLLRVYFIAAFVFMLHYLAFPENRMYQQELIFPFFCMCLPAFIYSSALHEWKVLKERMVRVSHIVFSVGIVIVLLVLGGKASIGAYSMALGYYLLLPAVVYLNEFLNSPSLRNILLALLSIISILALGSRGPVVWVGCFILLRLFRQPRKLRYSQAVGRLAFSALAIVLALFLEEILVYIQGLLFQLGFSSRTIWMFLGQSEQLGSRALLYREVAAATIDHPFVGIGIAGDRYVLGGYVHNIFLEVLANYGVPIGMMIVLGLISLQVRWFFCKDAQKYEIFSLWVSIGFLPLLVSGSYLESMYFWIFIGLMTGGRSHVHRYPSSPRIRPQFAGLPVGGPVVNSGNSPSG